jgi:peroxiredoxin
MFILAWTARVASGGALALSLVGCQAASPGHAVLAGNQTAHAAFTLPAGGELRLEELHGRVIVVAFFTTWCPASRVALRALEELRARSAPHGLEVLAVGEGESAAEVVTFAESQGLHARIAFDKGGVAANELALPTVPAVLVIARDGTVRHVHAGYHGEEDRAAISREVTALLVEASPSVAEERPAQLVNE